MTIWPKWLVNLFPKRAAEPRAITITLSTPTGDELVERLKDPKYVDALLGVLRDAARSRRL